MTPPGWLTSDAFRQAVAQFNAGEYFQCHETIEDELWRPMPSGIDKTCLQGILQIAVGLLHWQRGNDTGAKNLLTAGLAKLQPLAAAEFCAPWLNLAEVVETSESLLGELLSQGLPAVSSFPSDRLPKLRLALP